MSATADAIFQTLSTEGAVRALIDEARREDNYIEFKQKHDRSGAALHTDDTKHFAKAISSFSNSDGGVLVWGIETASQGPGQADVASKARPISDVEAFAERLRTALLEATMPVNTDVRIEAHPDIDGSGFVVCLIPEALAAPIRSQRDREYYVRMDGRGRKMEHYQIRDMMVRRWRPDLNVVLNSVPSSSPGLVRMTFSLRNDGLAIAKYPGLMARFVQPPQTRVVGTDLMVEDISALNSVPTIQYSDNSMVVHNNGVNVSIGWVDVAAVGGSLQGTLLVYCDGMTTKNLTFSLPIVQS